MFIETAYDTTVGKALNTRSIKDSINEALIRGLSSSVTLDLITSLKYIPIWVTGYDDIESKIPYFAHPIALSNMSGFKDKHFLVTDIRPYIKRDDNSFTENSIRNKVEFNFIKSRTVMNLAWLTGYQNSVKNNLIWAGTVFAAWLSNSISTRFALDPKDQLMLFIISHFYYQCMFVPELEIDEETKQKFAIHTIKASKAPSALVFEIFDAIGPISGIEDYCTYVKNILGNTRLKDFNAGFLITTTQQSWYGINSKEILAVALEHPPTWVALVYTALTERTYKNASIAKVAERYGKQGMSDSFLRSYIDLANEFIDDSIAKEDIEFKPF